MDALFWLLLPVAAISGWIAAFRHFKSVADNRVPDAYDVSPGKKNVGDFINTQPDKAVDIVIDKVEVSSDTVEVHLALGNLYRRSGEVNRAIRFHQNLSEKHSLSNSQRENILFELGRDYLSAGLLDRAERIFKDLLTTDEFKIKSSKALVEVFQQEKDWDEALEYAEMYEHLSKKPQKTRIAHYFCEKAERLNIETDAEKVKVYLSNALKKDKSCVRANILLGDLSFKLSDFDSALKHYLSAVEQDRAFLSVVFDNLIQCLQVVAKNEQLASLLPSSGSGSGELADLYDGSLADNTDIFSNQKKSMKYIEQYLDKSPTLSLLGKYLLLSLDDSALQDRKLMSQLKDSLFKIIKQNASYKCVSCGLGVHALHWQCPSCTSWSTIKPL